jgi:hypothetical protein
MNSSDRRQVKDVILAQIRTKRGELRYYPKGDIKPTPELAKAAKAEGFKLEASGNHPVLKQHEADFARNTKALKELEDEVIIGLYVTDPDVRALYDKVQKVLAGIK